MPKTLGTLQMDFVPSLRRHRLTGNACKLAHALDPRS